MARALRTSQNSNFQTVKPKPADDLWARIDEARAKADTDHSRPADSFTSTEYAAKYNVGVSSARRHIVKMLKAGLLEKHGVSSNMYYTLKEK